MSSAVESPSADPSPADGPLPPPTPPSGRSIGVRLFALALLLGVTSLFIDYRGLIRDASRSFSPPDLAAIPITVDALGAGTTVASRAVFRDADARTLELELHRPGQPFAAADARPVTAELHDAAGTPIGRQSAPLDVRPDGTARLRLTFYGAVRPARLVLGWGEG